MENFSGAGFFFFCSLTSCEGFGDPEFLFTLT